MAVRTSIAATGARNSRCFLSCCVLTRTSRATRDVLVIVQAKTGFATFLNRIAMKIKRLVNSSFLISVQSIVQDCLGLFRFSEADACAILSAYGLISFEVDRLQNNHPNEQKQTSGSWGKVIHRKRIDQPREPIPIGVHPDITWGNWMTASRQHVGRTSSRTVNP